MKGSAGGPGTLLSVRGNVEELPSESFPYQLTKPQRIVELPEVANTSGVAGNESSSLGFARSAVSPNGRQSGLAMERRPTRCGNPQPSSQPGSVRFTFRFLYAQRGKRA